MESDSFQLLLYTALLGFILGYVINKTNFCKMGAVSDWVNIGDLSRFKAWLLAGSVAIFGVTMFEFFNLMSVAESRIPYTNSVFFWPRYIFGGILFGIGMTYTSGC